MNVEDKLMEIYSDWLLEGYPDEIHTSDDHIIATQDLLHFDEFEKEVLEVLEEK